MSAPRDLDSLGRHTPWDGVKAVVAGFGVSGFAAADNLNHLGADVTALDESAAGKEEKAELLEVLGASIRLGEGATATLPETSTSSSPRRAGAPTRRCSRRRGPAGSRSGARWSWPGACATRPTPRRGWR